MLKLWQGALSFLVLPVYLYVAIATAAVGFYGGYKLRDLQAAKADLGRAHEQIVYRDRIIYKEREADAATQRIGEAAARAQVQIRTVTETLVKEVPVYVTVEADRQCTVPLGFVRVLDAAAAGRGTPVPDPAGQPNDAPSGLELSAVAASVTGNYGTYAEVARQLTDLQNWVRTQQALWRE